MRHLVPSLGLLVLAACAPEVELYAGEFGPRVSVFEPLDVGAAQLNTVARANLALVSEQRQTLTGARALGDAPVSVLPFVEVPGALFRFEVPQTPFTFGAGGVGNLIVTFDPPAVSVDTDFEATLELTFSTEDARVSHSTVRLVGHALAFTCGTPAAFEFGEVAVGDAFSKTVVVSNPRSVADQVGVVLEPADVDGFFLDGPSGLVTLPPQSSRELALTFRPTRDGVHGATLRLLRGGPCPEARVSVGGVGTAALVSRGGPEFPWLPLGVRLERPLRLENFVSHALPVKATATDAFGAPSVEFSVPGEVEVPAATRQPGGRLSPGLLDLPVAFTPRAEGVRQAVLGLTFDFPPGAQLNVAARGYGGAPRIALSPAVLTVPVTWDPLATPAHAGTAVLTLRNVGTSAPGHSEVNLHLRPPGFEVRSLSGAPVNEVCVGYDEAFGFCPGARPELATRGLVSGDAVELLVRVVPGSAGPRSFEVLVFSDDPDAPVSRVGLVVP